MPEQKDNGLIHFACRSCGLKIRVPQIHAGKKSKCPKCKNALVIPKTNCEETHEQQKDEDAHKYEQLSRFCQISESEEVEPPKRKVPWFIEMFIYPFSLSGIIHIIIFLFGPILINKIFLGFYFGIISLIFMIFLGGYVFLYLSYCVSNSSKGGRWAPDITTEEIPDKGDLFFQFILIFGCIAFCFFPVSTYYLVFSRTDTVFWLLSAFGIFFLPMSLLAAVTFGSVDALNPILITKSISRTFIPYCGLVLYFCLPATLVTFIISNLPTPKSLPGAIYYVSIILGYTFKLSALLRNFILCYLVMMGTYFLGRFYGHYKQKLDWGI